MIVPSDGDLLPVGVRAHFIPDVSGLTMHVLLHGFPEPACSRCKVMPALAQAGYHAIAPDRRGHGRMTGSNPPYDGDLSWFRIFNIVGDIISLIAAIGRTSITAVIEQTVAHRSQPGVRCCGRISSAVSRS
jgi:hypothetical protein